MINYLCSLAKESKYDISDQANDCEKIIECINEQKSRF